MFIVLSHAYCIFIGFKNKNIKITGDKTEYCLEISQPLDKM